MARSEEKGQKGVIRKKSRKKKKKKEKKKKGKNENAFSL